MSFITPTCPTGCSYTLPAVDFDVCDPKISFGEIKHIYIGAGDTTPFTDWTDLSEWIARIDNATLNDIDLLRDFHVMADLPMASSDEIMISLGRKIYSPATHIINVTIDECSVENYEFARMTSCNTQFRIWFATEDYLYGGNDGILASVNLRPVIERGQKSINSLVGTIQWENKFSPERTDSFDLDGIGIVTVTPPILVSAIVFDASDLRLDFDKDMSDPFTHSSSFSVSINGNPATVSIVGLDFPATGMFITITDTILSGDTVLVTVSGTDITSTDGGIFTVTNQICTNSL